MFNIGPQELLLILLVALVIVGPKRLPEITRTLGRGLRELRKAQDEVTKTIRLGLDDAEPTAKAPPRRPGDAPTEGTEATAAGGPGGAEGPATGPEPDETADIARSLGRGLAEIRRARREIQRTFRVDLSEEASPSSNPSPSTDAVPPDDLPASGAASSEGPSEPRPAG